MKSSEEKKTVPYTTRGWGNPDPYSTRSKFHYFTYFGMSLCHRWHRFAGKPDVEDDKDDHPDNCSTCKKKVAKYREQCPHLEVENSS